MDELLVDLLCCPECHGRLDWRIGRRDRGSIEAAEALCDGCGSHYAVEEGVALLVAGVPDPWAEVSGGIGRVLAENPELERKLLGDGELSATDTMFRALALDDRGRHAEARYLSGAAERELYTPETLEARERQFEHVVERLRGENRPVVDVASGRLTLVEAIARELGGPVVATDVSPHVLRRDRGALDAVGLADVVSLLACDAKRLPFRDGTVPALTTYVGLPNVSEPDALLQELRRASGGPLLAVTHFYPEEDEANAEAIRELGLEPVLYRSAALETLERAGWRVSLENPILAPARPTPPSELLGGARVDGLPVAETVLEWCVLAAEPV